MVRPGHEVNDSENLPRSENMSTIDSRCHSRIENCDKLCQKSHDDAAWCLSTLSFHDLNAFEHGGHRCLMYEGPDSSGNTSVGCDSRSPNQHGPDKVGDEPIMGQLIVRHHDCVDA